MADHAHTAPVIARRVLNLLRQWVTAICAPCLARAMKVSMSMINTTVAALVEERRVAVSVGVCSVCQSRARIVSPEAAHREPGASLWSGSG
jgi:hypothetical protein